MLETCKNHPTPAPCLKKKEVKYNVDELPSTLYFTNLQLYYKI